MIKIKPFILTLGLVATTALFFAGCSEGDHATMNHDDDGDEHAEHAGHDSDAMAGTMAGVAKQAATTVAALQVIENPTAEQLAAATPYTLKTCVLSGEELGSMGDPISVIVGDKQIKLCCENCLDDLKADPAKALAKLEK